MVADAHWLRAEKQSGGRGRRGHRWESPPGNLYCSTVVTLLPGDPVAHSLSFVTALAIDDLLNQQLRMPDMGVPRLKWPNDVMVNGAKIAGILLEQVGQTIVVGIGVNVAFAPAVVDRATTSIHELNGSNGKNAQQILAELAPLFAARIGQWRSHGLPAMLAAWEARAHPRGTALRVTGEGGDPVEGRFDGLYADGALRLRLDDGGERAIHAADVALL